MKKILSILLLIFLMIGIAGCAGPNTDTDQSTSDTETEATVIVVKLELDGGKVSYSKEFEWDAGDEIELPNATKDGYKFLGWYIGEEKIDFPYTPEEDVTFVAKWEELDNADTDVEDSGTNSDTESTDTDSATSDTDESTSDTETNSKVTITFDPNGGEIITGEATRQATPGKNFALVPEVEKEGYNFVGWATEDGEVVEVPFVVPNVDTTYYAKWSKITSNDTDTETDTDLDTETESETETETESETETDTSTESVYVPPLLDHDTMNYTPRYSIDNKKLYYGSYSVKVPLITEYYNNMPAALSMSFDDGDNVDAAFLASEIMSEYGLKGTLMVNINNIQGNLSRWQELVALGTLDIGSHGWDHKDPSSITTEEMEHEIKDSYDFLQENFGAYNPVTYATPLSRLTDEYKEYLIYSGFISNRLETSGAIISPSKENANMYTLYSKRIDTGDNKETNVRINVNDALNSGKWFIELYHSVVDNRYNTDVPVEDFRNHCKWLYDNYNGKVWFGSYDDVSKYIVQRQTATIEYIAADRESMTFLAKVDKNYGQEMTLKIYMPFFIDSAYAVIDGETQYLKVEKEPNVRVVYLNTEISEEGTEIKIYMGGNDKYLNNCTHTYEEKEVVAPTVDSFGYTEMICTNCENTYKKAYTEYVEPSEATTVSFKGETLSAPTLTNYYHNYSSAVSFTIDDGYDGNTATNVADVMEKYDMRCTAMLNPCFVDEESTIKKWQEALARGCL